MPLGECCKIMNWQREYYHFAKEEAEVRERGRVTDAERKRRQEREEAGAG